MDDERERSATILAVREGLKFAIAALESGQLEDLSQEQIAQATQLLRLAIAKIDHEQLNPMH